jgi:hypothetical protein
MHVFILVIICCVTLSEYLIKTFDLPPFLHFLPEMLSCVLIVYVFVVGTRDRFRLVAPKYWLAFAALAVVILCGIIKSGSGSGSIITGMRFYFRALPMFFLAAVLPPTDDKLRIQLKLLLALALLQLPVAGYQRWIIYSADRYSGDDVRGTLMDSGILSIFLICAVLILVGLLVKRRISKTWFTILFFLLLLPTTINETKATVIFLPLGLLVSLIVGAERGKRLRYAGLTLIALVAFGAIFVPVYDMLEEHNHYRVKIMDFFTSTQEIDKYLVAHGRHTGGGIGGTKLAGRGDSIMIPTAYLARDPVDLAFGLGLGNASPSNLGINFEGSYYRLFRSLLTTSFAFFLIELGVCGLILIGFLYWLMFSDCVAVARADGGLTGALAVGWTGVIAIFMLATVYNVSYQFPSMSYLYWYFTGAICARRVALKLDHARRTSAASRAYRATDTVDERTLST